MEAPRDSASGDLGSEDGKSRKSSNRVGTKSEEGSTPSESEVPTEKELLLCLRPIRDGEANVDEKLRFGCRKKKSLPKQSPTSPSRSESTKPPKKRRPDAASLEDEPAAKKAAAETRPVYNDVVESLMAMNKQSSL